jgi:hypothetical protein
MPITRRSLLPLFIAALVVPTAGAAYCVLEEAARDIFSPKLHPGLDPYRQKLLENIFFGGLARKAGEKIPGFVGVDQSSFQIPADKPSPDADGMKVAPDDDQGALSAIMQILPVGDQYQERVPTLTLASRNSAVLVASPITNPWTRGIFFDLTKPERPFELIMYDRRYFPLKYNFDRTQPTGKSLVEIKRKLANTEIREPNHSIISEGGKTYKSAVTNDGTPQDGYLLFSRLPHPIYPERSVALWSGNTGPATEAARLIVHDVPEDKLKFLCTKLREARHFQTLWHVDNITFDRDKGRHVANHIELLEDEIHVVNEYYKRLAE